MRFEIIVSAFCGLGLLAIAAKGDVIDQSQLDATADIANFDKPDLAQSFRPSYDNVSGAGIFLVGGNFLGHSGDITIALYDQLPNQGGTSLATATDSNAASGTFASVEFASPFSVVPDDTYYLVFTSSNSDMGIAGVNPNTYARGEAFANAGYTAYPSLSYAFETFSIPNSVAAPLPSAAIGGVVLLGVVGALALARRRRAVPAL